jgi:hypothetical protein
MNPTQTSIDVILLRNQLVNELATTRADTDAPIPLRRELVEQILSVLRHPRPSYDWDVETLRPAVLDEMRLLSPSGVGVSKQRWDEQRSRELPQAQRVCRLLSATWSVLVADAGLRPNPYRRRCDDADTYTPGLDDPQEIELEPEPPAIDGLSVLSTRVEVSTRGHIRTVTEIYTLR